MKRGVFLCSIMFAGLLSESALSVEKIDMPPGVRERLVESHRLYVLENAMKSAQHEVETMFVRALPSSPIDDAVRLPICDEERKPHPDWKYVKQGEGARVLKYVGGVGFGPQYIRWESAWVRIAGPRHIYREGMFCGEHNYIVVDIDKSFGSNRKFKNIPLQLVDGAILHLAADATANEPRVMQGEVRVAAVSGAPVRVAVELWATGATTTTKLLATTWAFVSQDPISPNVIRVEAEVGVGIQTLMVVRLDPALRERASKGESDSQLFVFDASVQAKEVTDALASHRAHGL